MYGNGKSFNFFFYSRLLLNDLEDFFIHENVPGLNYISDELHKKVDIFMKLFLYADDTVLMAETASNLQTLLDNFYLHCDT